ncbi:hypothetical protein [Mucilaginibacter paludis]|uniref:hypothetical protein n=1 Tax=Mucilaginibacter paludis TaxID=423351 RepID=UPI0001E9D672|nr:hypothetical protein [Mucilaginibacter paludis]
MSEEEFLAIARKRYEEVNALNDGMSFYDFEKRLSEIMDAMTRDLLETKIGKVPADRRKKKLSANLE